MLVLNQSGMLLNMGGDLLEAAYPLFSLYFFLPYLLAAGGGGFRRGFGAQREIPPTMGNRSLA